MKRLLSVEVGCANITDHSYDVRIDIKADSAANLVCDMREMNLPDNCACFIKSAATIEHVDTLGQIGTVKEFRRILVSGGITWIQTPDRDYWEARLEDPVYGEWAHIQMTGGMRDEFDYHKGLLNLNELVTLFEEQGFTCLYARDGESASGSLDCFFMVSKDG